MGFFQHVDQYLRDMYTLVSSSMIKRKLRIFFLYNWLVLKNVFSKITSIQFRRQKFLGYKVDFDNYGSFFALFTEMFVYNIYYFRSSEKAPFIVDCGGNIGMSLLYFKYLFPKAHIECYEPDPSTFQLLKKMLNRTNSLLLLLFRRAFQERMER